MLTTPEPFDPLPEQERPHVVQRPADQDAAMDDTGAWAEASQNRPEGQQKQTEAP
jgi:hypothetical protein